MTDLRVERVFEPSRIRRGRLATSPVFVVATPDGARWTFQRRRDAVAFVGAGGTCSDHEDFLCRRCLGRREPLRSISMESADSVGLCDHHACRCARALELAEMGLVLEAIEIHDRAKTPRVTCRERRP